jgi:GDP-mannose 6-dehydrogenase
MLGSNREYLQRQLPQIHQILRERLEDVIDNSDLIVVAQKRPDFTARLQQLDGRMAILDLVRMHDDSDQLRKSNYRGLSW